MRQVVILAGGKGTRLRARIGDRPKPLADVCGKPLLEHQIELAKQYGFNDIILLTGYGAQAIEDFCQGGKPWEVTIRCIREEEPLGSAGAVLAAYEQLAEQFLVMYGDTVLNVDLERFYQTHQLKNADATLFLHPNDHPYDSDLVELDEQGLVKQFHPYPHDPDKFYPNLVNAALYVINKQLLTPWLGTPGELDFGKYLFPQAVAKGRRLYGYNSPEYIKDAGTPERLDKVSADFLSGKLQRSSLAHQSPAVFLDRDGTLNVEVGHLKSAAELELLPEVPVAIKRLNHSDYRVVLVTNQPVIARGDCTEQELKNIHNKLETLLGHQRAYLDAIYYCPHHPDKGFAGERSELKIACECRKPEIGLIEQAKADLNLDLTHSWFIGDTSSDILAAQKAGVKSVLVRTGHAGHDGKYPARADFEFYALNEAVNFILDEYPQKLKQAETLLAGIQPGAFIAIGGLARSGKSIWAGTFKHYLNYQAKSAVVINLDCWLTSINERDETQSVLSRYAIDDINAFIALISSRQQSITVNIPFYNRLKRERTTQATTLTIQPQDILIIEGVIALKLEQLIQLAAKRFYVESNPALRKENFVREYRIRQFSDEQIHALYSQREVDETPIIVESRALADVILEGNHS